MVPPTVQYLVITPVEQERHSSCSLTGQKPAATMSTFSEQDLICPQCSEIYCLPVLLKCGHNVCKVCLHKYWEGKRSRECPVCFVVSVLGRPPVNLALKRAAEEYQVQSVYRNQDFCFHHDEKLKIFCQKDEEPICLICQMSKQHRLHKCCPIEEAAQQKRVQ